MKEQKPGKNNENYRPVLYALLAATIFVLVLNQVSIAGLAASTKTLTMQAAVASKDGSNIAAQGASVIPTGVPAVYGSELGVSYDDITAYNPQSTESTIRKLGSLDNSIQLSGNQLQRYVSIAGGISCEYCCGAESVIFTQDTGSYKAGDAACGCAHSYAMRGVAKYLITKHGSEFTDDQILEEMGKWKTLFFPTQITEKSKVLQQQGIELNYVNLASNKYRGIEQGSGSGGMVGGC